MTKFILVQLFPEETKITLTRGLYDYKACFHRSIKSLITLVCHSVDNLQVVFWFISSLRFFASGFFSIFRRLQTLNVFYSTLLQALQKFQSRRYFSSTNDHECHQIFRIRCNFIRSLRRFSEFYDSISFNGFFHSNIWFDSFRSTRFDSIRLFQDLRFYENSIPVLREIYAFISTFLRPASSTFQQL